MAIATGTAVALGLAAASAAAQAQNARRVAKKQDNEAARQIRSRGNRQREADAQVGQMIQKTAESSPEAAKASTLDRYMQTIRAQGGNAGAGLGQVGATSEAFRQSGADAALGIGDYGERVAGLLSRMDAPMLQRQQETVDRARVGSDLDRIKRFSGGDEFLSQLRMQGIRRDPWLDAFAAAASGAASTAGGSDGWASNLGWGGV